MQYVDNCVYRISGFEVKRADRVTRSQFYEKKIKDGHHDPTILPNFLKKMIQSRNYYCYAICGATNESGKLFCRYEGDKAWMWPHPAAGEALTLSARGPSLYVRI